MERRCHVAYKEVRIRRYKDGTASIKVASYIETIDVRNQTPAETYDALRWALVTAGVPFDNSVLDSAFRLLRGLEDE